MDESALPDRGDLREFLQQNPHLRPRTRTIQKPGVKRNPNGCRLIINDTVMFHKYGKQVTIPSRARYEVHLKTEDEQPYSKPNLKVGEEWQPLDFGWVETGIGYIHLINQEGTSIRKMPTKEQLAETLSKVVEVTVEGSPVPFAKVHPGRDCRFEVQDGAEKLLRIRCRKGEAKVQLVVYPL